MVHGRYGDSATEILLHFVCCDWVVSRQRTCPSA